MRIVHCLCSLIIGVEISAAWEGPGDAVAGVGVAAPAWARAERAQSCGVASFRGFGGIRGS
jgi:hypothetical protein